MKKLFLTVCLLLWAFSLPAAIITVDVNGQGDYTTIQDGIDAAADGDTILVYTGIYNETINFYGKEILVASEYYIDNDENLIDLTVIDGCQNGSVVKFGNSESKDSELCGFTIQNGSGTKIQIDDEYRDAGGGIWIRNSSPTVDHCIIKDNIAYRGGGIDCYNNCNPLITFCSFEYNEANEGGGAICCSLNCDMEIENCNFYKQYIMLWRSF